MALASLLEAVIRRCRCGMQSQATSCLPIMVISVGSIRQHGHPMVHALPRRATTGQCRSGRPFDMPLCLDSYTPCGQESLGNSQPGKSSLHLANIAHCYRPNQAVDNSYSEE